MIQALNNLKKLKYVNNKKPWCNAYQNLITNCSTDNAKEPGHSARTKSSVRKQKRLVAHNQNRKCDYTRALIPFGRSVCSLVIQNDSLRRIVTRFLLRICSIGIIEMFLTEWSTELK